MFRKIEEFGNVVQMNKSAVKHIKTTLQENYPCIADYLDDMMPKKASMTSIKIKSEHKTELILCDGQVLFVQKDKQIIPSLRILHKFPEILPKMQVDKGAIKFILGGANIMCKGLTSPGGRMENVPENSIVAVFAEGKQHALAIGLTKLSTQDIKNTNQGIAIDLVHFLNDGLWNIQDQLKLK